MASVDPTECKPILTILVFDKHPYAQVTITDDYQGKGGEEELLSAIFSAIRTWRFEAEKKRTPET